MRLLFVTPQVPWPATQGTALRNLHLIQAAASRHEVDLLTFCAPDEWPAGAAGGIAAGDMPPRHSRRPKGGERADGQLMLGPLAGLCRRIETVPAPQRTVGRRLANLAMGSADMEQRLWSPAFDARLQAMLRDGGYDAVQLEGFEVAGYLLGPAALRREAFDDGPPLPPIIFDDHNAEYELQASAARIDARLPRRWPRAVYSLIQAQRLRWREALYCAGADVCLAVSEADAAALERLVLGLHVTVVPNAIDCANMPAAQPGADSVIFFAGKLDFRPNVDACEWLVREILPMVRAEVPQARVVLAGRDPAPVVRQLAGPMVEVTGALSEADLAARRAAAWVYAVPLRMGGGVRFKALEAMAAGVPMVATTLGASGSGAAHGVHAMIADDAPSFAAAVVTLLERPDERERLAAAARRLAEARHDWRQIAPRLLALYDGLAAPRSPVSVATTLLNERTSAGRLLASLTGQRREPAEVIVVDGGSSDGTPDIVAAAGMGLGLPFRLLWEPGANISQGRNRAIGEAAHDVIAVTDGGVALHPAWLERLTRPLDVDSSLPAVGGFFVAAPATTWELALGATTLPEAAEINPARFLPSSRSVAFRRSAWASAGRYPEWLDYCEDLLFDLELRARCGPLRFQPRAVARFRPRASPQGFFKQYYRYARGDGKAGLWPRRHAIRYGTYLAGAALAGHALAGRGPRWTRPMALALLAVGAVTYVRRPLIRLAHQSGSVSAFGRAAPLVPLVRMIGDVAKMLGYPPGVLWRWRYRSRYGKWPEQG